jgi:hypothetical protein
MRYLLICCLLPVMSLCAAELTEDQQAEKDYQAYQETLRAEQLKAMEAKQRAEEVAQVEKDVATLKADYPELTPDAALVKLREDFKKATKPDEKWAKYGKLREIEPRVKALQARNANGTNVPTIAAVLTTEKAKIATVESIEITK